MISKVLSLNLSLIVTTSLLAAQASVVENVSKLHEVEVAQVIRPSTLAELAFTVKNSSRPLSIGGGRFSMGGQIAQSQSKHIDMRGLNKILAVDEHAKTVAVQAGATWRDVQEAIDPFNMSIKIMQTYANFSVGGSLSVNAHGRYIGEGPIVKSVLSINVMQADGTIMTATPKKNSDLFFGVIGGYGGLGIIVEAKLQLEENIKLEKRTALISAQEYKSYFFKNIRDNQKVLLHNGDLYPPSYDTVRSESWLETNKPLTNLDRLQPKDKKYWLEPSVISLISSVPFGTTMRSDLIDPFLDKNEVVVWRNYEASYDVSMLEPTTPRWLWTYVLQEYFVPVKNFHRFLSDMKDILQKFDVNVVNVSIRHALPDPGTVLAWASEEVFCFVIYYKQGTSRKAQKHVTNWTNELIDTALRNDGRYYLPYQIIASQNQFETAYPGYRKFQALKKKYDPNKKFQNTLINHYFKL